MILVWRKRQYGLHKGTKSQIIDRQFLGMNTDDRSNFITSISCLHVSPEP